MYIPEYFKLYEVLPKQLYEENIQLYGKRLWTLFDDRLLITADRLRAVFGTMVVNTWYHGGRFQHRGWRPMDCEDGAKFSQHKYGRALDLIPIKTTADYMRQVILNSQWDYPFKLIMCVEDGITWFHFDVRNHDKEEQGIKVIYP